MDVFSDEYAIYVEGNEQGIKEGIGKGVNSCIEIINKTKKVSEKDKKILIKLMEKIKNESSRKKKFN